MFFLKGNIIVVFLISVSVFSFGQNLVPNGSFEEFINCPNTDMSPEDCPPWFTPTEATSDVFNRCNPMGLDSLTVCPLDTGNTNLNLWNWAVPINVVGCQEPHSGDGYAGIFLYHSGLPWREYLQVPLFSQLISGYSYTVRMYVSLSDQSIYGTENIHFGFVSDSLHYDNEYAIDFGVDLMNPFEAPIMEKEEWVEFTWEYIADGTEEYLVIGNFYTDENTIIESNNCSYCYGWAYYYIDDVYVGKSTEDLLYEDEIIYPELIQNPVHENIQIIYEGSKVWKYDVYNTIGQLIIYDKMIYQNDVNFLSKGFYLLKLRNGSNEKIISFVKV